MLMFLFFLRMFMPVLCVHASARCEDWKPLAADDWPRVSHVSLHASLLSRKILHMLIEAAWVWFLLYALQALTTAARNVNAAAAAAAAAAEASDAG
jgi:hypothetical protein